MLSPAADAGDVNIERATSTKAREDQAGIKGLKAHFLVNAPQKKVLETLWDVKRFRAIFPDIKKLEVSAATETKVVAAFYVDAVVKKLSYTLDRRFDRKGGVIYWRELAGDLKYVRGRWIVEKVSEKVSRVTYLSFVDVGTFVPTGMYRDLAMKKVNEMVGRVRAACIK